MNKRIATLWKFLTYDIWRITEDEVTKTTFSLYNIIKTIYLCINRFTKDRLVNKASALTYSTLLAIVPILAIVFAIARGFGFDNLMESQIRQGLRRSVGNNRSDLSVCQLLSVANQKRHIYRDRFDHVVVDRTQPDQ